MTSAGLFSENNRNNLQPLLDAVEGNNIAVKHPHSVSWTIEWLRNVVAQRGFKPLRRIVAEIADCAARKRHQSRTTRERAPAEIISDPFSRDCRIRLGLTITLDKRLHSLSADDHVGLGAEKGVTSDSFTTFNRFEQESVWRVAGNAHESADGRVQIC